MDVPKNDPLQESLNRLLQEESTKSAAPAGDPLSVAALIPFLFASFALDETGKRFFALLSRVKSRGQLGDLLPEDLPELKEIAKKSLQATAYIHEAVGGLSAKGAPK